MDTSLTRRKVRSLSTNNGAYDTSAVETVGAGQQMGPSEWVKKKGLIHGWCHDRKERADQYVFGFGTLRLAAGVHAFPDRRLVEPSVALLELASIHGSLVEDAAELLVCSEERHLVVRELVLGGKLDNLVAGNAQVMARQARKEVVLELELQAAMEPVEPVRTGDVGGGHHLVLDPSLIRAAVESLGDEVAESDLDVQNTG
mmetsp:Transcript_13647/g.34667  ORF Transcript_13647/g.34667 Transcript_13647/m.34667 type:complete len:201 (+) Transcript_13647:54-656(+)